MNLLMKITLILSVFSANTFVYGQGGAPLISYEHPASKTFFFSTNNLNVKDFQVALKGNNGETMFSEYVRESSCFERYYNLDELQAGIYFLTVEKNASTWVQPIIINNDGLQIIPELHADIHNVALHQVY